ncbi:FecR domain-containing protein [Fulvivirgaceae bacterium BMA12]|uniref:FecR domain-containing protein n=1 Tax=Agaribacillus aureus TaxID=3051825 RepID=A0ABT8L6I7_9BACT|nr:FecR domain-containing protein [Fulvivirgaceae bacterium BMA12]
MENLHIWEIIGKQLKQEATAEEVQQLEQWLSASKSNQTIFDESKKIWEASGVFKFDMQTDADEEWESFKAIRDAKPAGKEVPTIHKTMTNWNRIIYPVAATVLLLIAATVFYLRQPAEGKMVTKATTDQRIEFKLPDGSNIWLNKNSKISYNESEFLSNRRINLSGEAFFEVAENPESPFTIVAGASLTRVVGTAFNLNASNPQRRIELVVVAGKVTFGKLDGTGEPVVLTKGLKGIYNPADQSVTSEQNTSANFLSWQNATLQFDNLTMASVIEDCEKYFDVKVQIQNPKILNCKYTGNFTNPSVEVFFTVIASTLNITYKIQDGVVTLDGEGCEDA